MTPTGYQEENKSALDEDHCLISRFTKVLTWNYAKLTRDVIYLLMKGNLITFKIPKCYIIQNYILMLFKFKSQIQL